MAYEGFRSSQPYDKGGFTTPNTYASPQPFRASGPPPFPDSCSATSDGSRFPPQHPSPSPQCQPPPPAPIPPPPTTDLADPLTDPMRFYQNQHTPQRDPPPFQQKIDVPPEVIAQITASVVQQLQGLNFAGNSAAPAPNHPAHNTSLAPFTPSVSEFSHPSTTQVYTPPSPFRGPEGSFQSPQFSNVQFAQIPHNFAQAPPVEHDDDESQSPFDRPGTNRPKPSRLSTQDETPVEKTWGQLFDRDGVPTSRFGQLVRGVAMHLIQSYAPGNTLVVTPQKMQKYYEDTKSPGGPYAWNDVFDDRTSSISRLYREVQAEHHLIQDRTDERPDIPGLTPGGFERWMRLMVVAYPDQECERLQRTLLEMPISNPDDPKERFPKDLPRRLFPKFPDHNARGHMDHCILTHCRVSPSRYVMRDDAQYDIPRHRRGSPPLGAPLPSSDPRLSSPFEIEEDEVEDDVAPAQPIERERKPYSVQIPNQKLNTNAPIEQVKQREGARGGRQSPIMRSKHDSKDFSGSEYPFVKTPTSARPREDTTPRYRDQPREKETKPERVPEFGREKHSNQQAYVNWEDEEDYYRPPSPVAAKAGRRSPAYDESADWPFR
ncbi:hypothetical protein LOZ57_002902 [Ophidiomyces ophidiicola]|uniref:uncharacterized protein n=1 Tax=Ophidiomyces ophidiicola TaxID=1387563 RepID=UPI0020C47E95|nr:uncharacterized protein LOZ57_002902 [Ophidiomyces ophidiicola]KAI1948543.1 hypothetical protein LOZ57_002902 [Ophidiomyces ophidiicola]KAI2053098.1 hypothetical protein LOZ43_004313 [Ophidiomyces ophidiicola]